MKESVMRLAMGVFALGLILTTHSPVFAQDTIATEDLMNMELEELLDLEISVASKKSESHLEAPGVVVVVPREEFTVYGDRNLHQLLQRQPSVYTRYSFVYSDNLAGFRGDMLTHAETHTLVLFNGRPIRESAQGHNVNMYKTFPLASLESVELIRGPGSVLYGSNAFAGVVNLRSRPVPEELEFSVSAMTGSHEYYDTTLSAGGRSGDLGFVADVRVSGQQGYDYRMTDAMGVSGEHNKDDKGVSGTLHLDYRGLTFDLFASDVETFTLGVQPFWSNPHDEIRNKKLFANAGYRLAVHDRATLELNLTYNLQENVLSSYDPWKIGTNTSDILGEVTLYTNPLDNLNVVLGYLHEDRRNYAPDDDYFQSIPSYDYSPDSAYAQADYKIGESVKLIVGGQWNESPLGDTDVISRFGVIFTPFERWGLKLLLGEAFRAPVTLESDLDDPLLMGNDDLKPETVTTYDAQLFYHDDKTYAAVTYFNSTIEDLIIYDASVSPMSYMNGGEHDFDGIEVEAKYYFTPHWHVLGSFMYQKNHPDAGLNPSVVPEKMAKLGTAYTWDRVSAAVFYSYFGTPPRIRSPLVVNPTPEALNLVSLNLRMDVSEWMGLDKGQSVLTLRAENIVDEEIYVPTFAYTGTPNSFPYGPGATFYAGLTVNF
ncbi:MAG: TonB-dependent receptor [Thermodesulfobacteriota bacterium]|nr:TonB-dependent receptor [Thermodesulfobacteriota bacterium]